MWLDTQHPQLCRQAFDTLPYVLSTLGTDS
jgi:hypothetical protein